MKLVSLHFSEMQLLFIAAFASERLKSFGWRCAFPLDSGDIPRGIYPRV